MRKFSEKAVARSAAMLLLGGGCLFSGSCQPPPEKPIPPLDLSKSTAKPEPSAPASPATLTGQLTRMPLGDLYQLVQKDAALIYDVRPTLYYKMGHIPGAISWPKKEFSRDYERHAPAIRTANTNNTPVVLYCTDLACPDGLTVAQKLATRGHDVSVLQGGYEAWKVATD